MESYLEEWFKSLASDKTVQRDMRQAYPHLPEFHVVFHQSKPLTWIPLTD